MKKKAVRALLARSNVTLALVAFLAATTEPAAAQDIKIRDFPKIFGTYAVGGDCTRFPRVVADASGIKIVTATGTSVFQHTGVTLGYNGRDDNSTTVMTQGPGDGLVLQFENGGLTISGGDNLGAAEKAVAAIGEKSDMRRCGMRAAPPPPQAAAPAQPVMRRTAATSVAALAKANVMADPGFKAAYLQALGPLQRESWLIDMDGPGDQGVTTAAGSAFLQVSTCKDRDCGDNAMLVLYRPQPRTLWGIVSLHRRKVLIGNPPPAIVPQLQRLFKAAWPAG